MPDFLISLLASSITGGLAGAILTIIYGQVIAKQSALAKEKAAISALAGELRRSRLLCDHNSKFKQNATAPFIHFPTMVSAKVTFGERHSYPHLGDIQSNLEAYTLAASQVNQLIDLHHQLWTSPEQPSGVTKGASGRREEIRFQIADICSGEAKIESVGPDGFLVLPKFIDFVSRQVEEISAKLSARS